MSTPDAAPSSWRDVYQLVRDTREDIMVAVGNVDTKVSALGDRVTGIEGDRQDEKVARKTEASLAASRQRRLLTLISASRGGIALLISFTTAVWVIVHGHA